MTKDQLATKLNNCGHRLAKLAEQPGYFHELHEFYEQTKSEQDFDLVLTTLRQIHAALKGGYTYHDNEHLDEVIRRFDKSDDNA